MKRWMRAARRLRRCDAGAVAIEFAIISLVMILVCLAVIEFGRGLYVRNQLSYVADYAARMILLDIPDSDLEAEIRERFHGGAPERLEIALPPVEDGFRAIQLSYPFTLLIPGVVGEPITVSVERRVPVPVS